MKVKEGETEEERKADDAKLGKCWCGKQLHHTYSRDESVKWPVCPWKHNDKYQSKYYDEKDLIKEREDHYNTINNHLKRICEIGDIITAKIVVDIFHKEEHQ